MTELTTKTLAQMRDGLKAKEFSSEELTRAHFDAIEKTNPGLNAYILETPEVAFAQAKAADEKLAKGEAGLIEGVPVGVKDLFCTKDVRTTSCSKILEHFVPPYESTVSQRCWDAGGVMLGKLNMDQFAMGSANVTSYFGDVVNPWKKSSLSPRDEGRHICRRGEGPHPNPDRSLAPSPEGEGTVLLTPGGSSGGSSAAVAANLCPVALGTDTGGSIRQPAAFCGIVGLKPTYGRCSRYGMIAFASSLDQAGPITRTVRDSAIMMNVIAGHDAKDSTMSNRDVPDFEAMLTGDIKGKKIGIPKEYRPDGIDSDIEKMWDDGAKLLQDAGAEIIEISLPHTKYALPAYYVIAPAEASSNLARYDGIRYGLRAAPPYPPAGGGDEGGVSHLNDLYIHTRAAGFGVEVKRRILIGTYVLSSGYYDAYYKKAQRVRRKIADDFSSAFETVDAILTPTAPSAAFEIGAKQDDPIQMYLNDIFTVPSSLAGLPAISIPAALDKDGLPLGLQLIGKSFDEANVINTAGVLEEVLAF